MIPHHPAFKELMTQNMKAPATGVRAGATTRPTSGTSRSRAQQVRAARYGGSSTPAIQERAGTPAKPGVQTGKGVATVLLRQEIGDVLREVRQRQGRTLREVSSAARVSLGYLSEVERGQKEASSELIGSICEALNVPLSGVLHHVADRIGMTEPRGQVLRGRTTTQAAQEARRGAAVDVVIPDTVPEELVDEVTVAQH